MIKFISAEDTLPLRSAVLRNGDLPANCYFEADLLPSSFHMGYFHDSGELICILTCQLEAMEGYSGLGYRLRGMATHPQWKGKGIGSELLRTAIGHLSNELQADYVWCNARKAAYSFYLTLGFEMLSEEFEIAGIGPHKVMYLGLR